MRCHRCFQQISAITATRDMKFGMQVYINPKKLKQYTN